jgi:hypothetical protein
MARLAAALVALVAWVALAVQLDASFGFAESLGEALWAMLRYFTVLTNLLVAVVMSFIALGVRVPPFVTGGTTLSIVLVGVVFFLLLRGLLELSGGAALADLLMHKVTPVLVPLWWLAFADKGGLRRRDCLLWALYPLAYFGYALVRGKAEGRYAYPFIDVASLGGAAVALNGLLIALGFVIAGLALVALDARMARTVPNRSHE